MSESKHTPWRVELRKCGFLWNVLRADGLLVATATTKERADLIAAAPDLAEALTPFAEAARLGAIGGRPPFEFASAHDYERARVAIDRAAGKE